MHGKRCLESGICDLSAANCAHAPTSSILFFGKHLLLYSKFSLKVGNKNPLKANERKTFLMIF